MPNTANIEMIKLLRERERLIAEAISKHNDAVIESVSVLNETLSLFVKLLDKVNGEE